MAYFSFSSKHSDSQQVNGIVQTDQTYDHIIDNARQIYSQDSHHYSIPRDIFLPLYVGGIIVSIL